jgi:hypothetical protein
MYLTGVKKTLIVAI